MAAASDSTLVLVTGASTYLASHVIKQLLEEGYKVRGTVASLENEEKLKPLKELNTDSENQVELVEADLSKPESWESAVKDCVYVIHTECPDLPCSEVEDEVVKPAVEANTSVLKACQAAKTVKRVVLTSSLTAVSGGLTGEDDKTYTEEDWANTEKASLAVKSRVEAEKAAWDFVKELPEGERFELSVVIPGYVMGPIVMPVSSTSVEIPKKLLERGMHAIPKLSYPIVDVRDVAAATIKAMTLADAADKRHLLYSSSLWMADIAQLVAKEFKPQGYNVPTTNWPFIALKLKGFVDKNTKANVLPNWGKTIKIDNTRMKEVLGVTPRDVNETIIDMCNSMIEADMVKKPKPKKACKKAADTPAEKPAEGEEEKKEEEEKKDDGEKKEENKEEVKENGEVKDEKKDEKEGEKKDVEEKKEVEEQKEEETEKKE